MSNLDDLNYKSITEMSTDEAIELLRQTRLSRRVPVKKVSKTTKKSKQPKSAPAPTADQAAQLLKLLTGGN